MNSRLFISKLYAIGALLIAPLYGEEKSLLPKPESLVKAGASWAMRIDVDASFKTPLTFIVSARGKTTTVSTYRFLNHGRKKEQLDLSHHMTLPSKLELPQWFFELKEQDRSGGLDGTSTSVTIHNGEKSRTIRRWTPGLNAASRGLDQYVGLIDRYFKYSGIQARSTWSGFDLVEFTLPVPNEFIGAADMLKRRKNMTIDQLLKNYDQTGDKNSKVHFDLENRTLTGQLPRDGSIALQSFVAECLQSSERSIYERLLSMLPDKNDKDPFASPK